MLLERVALHQTRLKVPGLGLDAKGVALGARGLVLFATLDRLAAFLATYSREQSLEAIAPSCRIEVLRSSLGLRELAFSFDAESTERLDRLGQAARLVGGLTFTGSGRHFVQYRDAQAPFGYDAPELGASDAQYVLYHSSFSQSYELERALDLRRVLLWLEPRPEGRRREVSAPLWLLIEPGLGGPLASHLSHAGIDASATLLDDARWLFRLDELPARVRALIEGTPGIVAFRPVGTGVAVELGFEHPVLLEVCPVFDPAGLVLLRGRHEPPLCIERLPLLGRVGDLVRIVSAERAAEPLKPATAGELEVRIELVPGISAQGAIRAAFIAREELELLRRIAYHVPSSALKSTLIAVTDLGAFAIDPNGLDALPLGLRYREIHPNLFLPVGHTLTPAVAPALLFDALGAPSDRLLFLRPGEPALAVAKGAFGTLEQALAHADRWLEVNTVPLPSLTRELGTVWLAPLGVLPLKDTR